MTATNRDSLYTSYITEISRRLDPVQALNEEIVSIYRQRWNLVSLRVENDGCPSVNETLTHLRPVNRLEIERSVGRCNKTLEET
jgi:hypothetical protein